MGITRSEAAFPDGRRRSDEVAVRFGRNLRRCRRQAALSQEELGLRASLHRTEIGLLETGARVARVDTLMKLAGALTVPPAELLKGIHWKPGSTAGGHFRISKASTPGGAVT
jgi:DNA-binding XRE family transcriptional regulator